MKNRNQWLVVGGSTLTIGALLIVGLVTNPDLSLIAEGSAAPGFAAVDVFTESPVSLNDYEGKVVLLNIWATDCPPCEEEMPSLQRLHDAMGSDEFAVVAVSIDVISTERVARWVEERDLTFPIVHDVSGDIQYDYRITGKPETFLIDRDGIILRKIIGPREWDGRVERNIIERIVEGT